MTTNIQKRIAHNITHRTIRKPNGREVTVPRGPGYEERFATSSALALAFTRAVVGREFAK